VEEQLAIAQMLRYADELRRTHAEERAQRRRAEDALDRLREGYTLTVRALATALECRDGESAGHAERVTELGLLLAERVAPELMADPELEYGFLLHDLGKIGVPDAILLKPRPLDEHELAEMRRHPELGARILAGIPYLSGLAGDVVVAHHERWDGSGYPSGLGGLRIPRAARIFAVVDAFDAITSDRPYREAQTAEVALSKIREGAGAQFEPAVVEAFLALARQRSLAA
jgi:HD-GYP domain-containing protein (c-di-GMP phosphodiesterase class II)